MDNRGARAIGLALSLYFLRNTLSELKTVFHLSDRFADYIDMGQWPQEALKQIGKVKEEDGRIARVRAEVQGKEVS